MANQRKTKSDDEKNRRESPRIELRQQLTVRADGKEVPVITANFGFGGVFVETENPLPVDAKLTVMLRHEEKTGETVARVVRQDDDGMAVAFIEPDDDFTSILITVVSPHLEPPPKRSRAARAQGAASSASS